MAGDLCKISIRIIGRIRIHCPPFFLIYTSSAQYSISFLYKHIYFFYALSPCCLKLFINHFVWAGCTVTCFQFLKIFLFAWHRARFMTICLENGLFHDKKLNRKRAVPQFRRWAKRSHPAKLVQQAEALRACLQASSKAQCDFFAEKEEQ